jgi:hypothetical protein
VPVFRGCTLPRDCNFRSHVKPRPTRAHTQCELAPRLEKERGQDKVKPDNSAIMGPITHNLTEAQVEAVAAYLGYLE